MVSIYFNGRSATFQKIPPGDFVFQSIISITGQPTHVHKNKEEKIYSAHLVVLKNISRSFYNIKITASKRMKKKSWFKDEVFLSLWVYRQVHRKVAV